MADKKLVRVFPLACCKQWKKFVFDDFGHNNRMTLVCHRHPVPIVMYITWKQGIDKEDFDKAAQEYKENLCKRPEKN